MQIRDPRWKKFGSGMEKTRIRDPGSGINIPDPATLSVSRGDCEYQEGKLIKLLSQLRPRIQPLVDKYLGFVIFFSSTKSIPAAVDIGRPNTTTNLKTVIVTAYDMAVK